MITIRVFANLRMQLGKKEIQLEGDGKTVLDILNLFVHQYPMIKEHLFDSEGKVRSFFSILVNDKNIRLGDGLQTPLKNEDVVVILPPIGGG